MTVLAIDTATATCSLALAGDGGLMGEDTFPAGRSHLELLLPAIQRLLAENARDKSDLRAIIVGTGPGTFSGLRVGVATARALAQGLAVSLYGSGSLDALAAGLAAATDSPGLLPVIDARRGQVFSRLFTRDDAGKPVPQSEIMCLSPAELLAVVADQAAAGVFAGGDGVQAYDDHFRAAGNIEVPDAGAALHAIRARYHLPPEPREHPYSFQENLKVMPVYVREPDADKTVLLRKREPWLE